MAFGRGPLVGEGVEGTRIVIARLAEPAAVTTQTLAPGVVIGPLVGLILKVEGNRSIMDGAGAFRAGPMGGKENASFLALPSDSAPLLEGGLRAGNGSGVGETDMNLGFRRTFGR